MRNIVFLAALAATVATASPAFAQATPAPAPVVSASDTAEARGTVLQPLTLTRTEHLDFGTIISTADAGTVSINADDGKRDVTLGVLGVPGQEGGRGVFKGNATPGSAVTLTLNAPKFLFNDDNALQVIEVTNMVLDAENDTTRTVGPLGVFEVGVGGLFAITANQPNGVYRADFDLTADYQ